MRPVILILTVTLIALLTSMLSAQESAPDGESCEVALRNLWEAASDACLGGPPGFICNGGSAPSAQPEGPINASLSAPGALVELGIVDALQTPALIVESSAGGIAYMRLPEPLRVTGLLIGAVSVRDTALPGFPAWQSLVVETDEEMPACAAAPASTFVVQTPPAISSTVIINGASLVLNGTVAIQTDPARTLFVSLAGVSRVIALGQEQVLNPGEQISVPHVPGDYSIPAGGPSVPVPFDPSITRNLPVGLLDRPVMLPQPGYVATAGQVNMRAAPSTEGVLLAQVPAGQVLSVLGRNAMGDWYHVRLATGETGWMFADLLRRNVGEITAIYDATPMPPGRYGMGGQTGRVLPETGINLREAPDVGFPIIYTLPAGTEVTVVGRSPYSPWVKVSVGDVTGWAALITLETTAIFDILPIDYSVPPPPPPTRVPGSFGNAFPNPNQPGNP